MQERVKSYLINHTNDAIEFLKSQDFIEQPAVITTDSEDSPLRIIVMPEKKLYFAICSYNESVTFKLTKSILGATAERATLEEIRKEIIDG